MKIPDETLSLIFSALAGGLMGGGWDVDDDNDQHRLREWRTGRSWIRTSATTKWAEVDGDVG
jgi:hypothetical protein